MKKLTGIIFLALSACSLSAHAAVSIGGSVSGNNGSTVGTSVAIGAPGEDGVAVSVDDVDVISGVCASPFMRQYAAICQ